jgi:hypothetical protein
VLLFVVKLVLTLKISVFALGVRDAGPTDPSVQLLVLLCLIISAASSLLFCVVLFKSYVNAAQKAQFLKGASVSVLGVLVPGIATH